MAAEVAPERDESLNAHLRAWECHEVLREGERIYMRPLRPEDAALYPDFLAAVTPEDMRLRFFAPVKELSAEMIDKLTHVDYSKDIAFIALDEESGAMLGVVRLHRDRGKPEGEFAVLVRSALKGHGLGWLLMRHMIAYAMANGFRLIHGEVLAENVTVLAMCARLGFHIANDPTQRGIMIVTLDLETGAPKRNLQAVPRV